MRTYKGKRVDNGGMCRLGDWVYGCENPSLIIGNTTDNPNLLKENK